MTSGLSTVVNAAQQGGVSTLVFAVTVLGFLVLLGGGIGWHLYKQGTNARDRERQALIQDLRVLRDSDHTQTQMVAVITERMDSFGKRLEDGGKTFASLKDSMDEMKDALADHRLKLSEITITFLTKVDFDKHVAEVKDVRKDMDRRVTEIREAWTKVNDEMNDKVTKLNAGLTMLEKIMAANTWVGKKEEKVAS